MSRGFVPAPGASAHPGGDGTRRLYALTAAGFALFAIWGSLFPFDFQPTSLAAVAARFAAEWTAGRTVAWSLTDMASNVLLFVPIGLFVAAAVADGRSQRIAAATTVAFAGSVALSAAIEFIQAFVPSRTPSMIDIAAEACGAAAGAALWRYLGAEIDALSAAAVEMLRRSTVAERLLLLYSLIFAAAWLAPADFTLRPAEIGDKYAHQRLVLPFIPSPDAATRTALGITLVASIPVGIAAMLCGCSRGRRRTLAAGAAIAAASLVALEVGQIFVFSRTTDGASLLAALAGALCGAFAAAGHAGRPMVQPRPATGVRLTSVVVWLALAVLVEWWPFHAALNPVRASAEMTAWSRAPFRWPTALSDIVPGALLAIVAGLWLRRDDAGRFIRLHTVLVVALGAITFLVFETGRVLLSGARPTLLSVAIKTAALAVALHAHGMPTSVTPSRRRTQ